MSQHYYPIHYYYPIQDDSFLPQDLLNNHIQPTILQLGFQSQPDYQPQYHYHLIGL
jgi:hypothetical protein